MMNIKEISIHLFLPEMREMMNLEGRWFEDTPEEVLQAHKYYSSKKRRRE